MEKNTMVLGAALALVIGGVGGYALGELRDGREEYGYGMMGTRDKDRGPKRTDDRSYSMGGMGMTGDHSMHTDMMVRSEREFIEHMIPHHQEAIDTAKEVLARGATTPEIKALVEGIVTAQEKEVADMKTWYESWYGTAYTDKGTYRPMMRELANLSGAELDKAFLEDMVHHHMGAIMMAKSVESHIEHEEMRTLAKNIVTTQSTEIETMRALRNALP